jgi:hypothetical protein
VCWETGKPRSEGGKGRKPPTYPTWAKEKMKYTDEFGYIYVQKEWVFRQ